MKDKLIELNSKKKEKAFLVVVDLKSPGNQEKVKFLGLPGLVSAKAEQEKAHFTTEEESSELKALAESTGSEVVGEVEVFLSQIRPALYIGKGKAEEISIKAQEEKADVVVFNIDLSSSQQRNLEDILGLKTIDRTQLILDIFARHAKSNAGKIQVELAQLEYLLPRLKGKGIMLSRLGGGIGTRGPGEKKLEVERRRIEERIGRLRKELEKVRDHRDRLRVSRQKQGVFVVALVGYTSAGKTTLLNCLTDSAQKTEQALFTTLDPLSRMLKFKEKVVVSDTVGFIHDLPEKLVQAFKATLEELEYADILLHVIDISKPNFKKRVEAVSIILKELNLDEKPLFKVFNQIDKVSSEKVNLLKARYPKSLFISAKHNQGMDALEQTIEKKVLADFVTVNLSIPYENAEAMSFLYKKSQVLDTSESCAGSMDFRVSIRANDLEKLRGLL